jgi:hypothetical protein
MARALSGANGDRDFARSRHVKYRVLDLVTEAKMDQIFEKTRRQQTRCRPQHPPVISTSPSISFVLLFP